MTLSDRKRPLKLQVGKLEEPGQPRVHNPIWQRPLTTLNQNQCIKPFISHGVCVFCVIKRS